MKSLAVTFVGALLLTGCGSVRYPASYVLNLPALAPQPAPAHGTLGPVAIREFQCPEYLREGRIVYRPTQEEVGFYEYHRWATDPREAITQYLQDNLRARSLFQSVTTHERGSEAAYVLSGNIERFEEVDENRDVRVVCTISAQLLDTRTRSAIWSHTATEMVSVKKRDIPGVVSSLSVAAQNAVERLIESMARKCSQQPAESSYSRHSGSGDLR